MAKKARPVFVWAKDIAPGDTITYTTTAEGKGGPSTVIWSGKVKAVEHTHVGNFPIVVTFENGDTERFMEYTYVDVEPANGV